jgi:hypothetical protein
MFYLFALFCCSCIIYYSDDLPFDALWQSISTHFASRRREPGAELAIHDTLELEKYGFDVYITNYSIHHKTYSVHSPDKKNHHLIKQYVESEVGNKLLRKVVFAELRGIYGKEDVTTIIRSAQGLKCDFHKEILETECLWDHVLYEYDLDSWDVLTLVDSFGHIHNITMKDTDRIIVWNPEFVL